MNIPRSEMVRVVINVPREDYAFLMTERIGTRSFFAQAFEAFKKGKWAYEHRSHEGPW